jgi:serine phosphatase RsbU (regulator of sigma subunit)
MNALTLPGTPDSIDRLTAYIGAAAREFGFDRSIAANLAASAGEIFAKAGPADYFRVQAIGRDGDLVLELAATGHPDHPQDPPEPDDGVVLLHESAPRGNLQRLIVRRKTQVGFVCDAVPEERRKLQTLLTVAESLGREIQLDALLKLMVAEVTGAMRAERTTLFLVDRRKPDELVSRVAEGAQEIRVPFGVGIAGATARSRATINVPDAYQDSRFNQSFDKLSGFRTRNILSTPLMSQGGRLLGVVQVLNKKNGVTFTRDDERFLDSICVHLAIALERAEMVEAYLQTQIMAKSLELAREIQMGLVPRDFPALQEFPEVDVFAAIVPALDVGGDLYDFFSLDQDRICFIIGDVSDKGVPAALFMALVRTAFKMAAIAAPESIVLTMIRVNQVVCESNPQQMFVTAFAGILDLRNGHVDYVDAGHEPPLVRGADGSVQKLDKAGNIVLGLMPEYPFSGGGLDLARGDNLVLYTDGATEAMNAAHEPYGADRMENSVSQAGASAASVIEVLLDDIRGHAGEARQSDDITLLAIRYLGRSR